MGCGNYSVNEMPYSHIGTNTGMGDNWNVAASDGEDVAYTLTVGEVTTYDFTLCSENTDYDTKLEIFERQWRQKFPSTPLSRIGQIRKSKSKAPYIDSQTNEALPWIKGFEHLIDT